MSGNNNFGPFYDNVGVSRLNPWGFPVPGVNSDDFTMSLSISNVVLSVFGSQATFSLTLDSLAGFNKVVALGAFLPTISPGGVSVTFSNLNPTPLEVVKMTVLSHPNSVPGLYGAQIVGTSGSIIHSVSFGISIV